MVRRMQESTDNIFYCAECTYDKSNGTMFLYTTDITEVKGRIKPKDSMNVEGGFLVRRKYFRSEYEAQEYIDSLPNSMPMSRNESLTVNERHEFRHTLSNDPTDYERYVNYAETLVTVCENLTESAERCLRRIEDNEEFYTDPKKREMVRF